jgi:putative heme iron utilization protein
LKVARQVNGIHEVSGSIPLGSTNNISILEQKFERSRSAEIVLRNANGTSRL